MRHLQLLLAILGLSICAASQMSPSGPTNLPGTNSSVPGYHQGCLERVSGGFRLVESPGKAYNLVSSTVSLNGYVGQQVRILAESISVGDPSSDEQRSAIEAQNIPSTLDVSDVSQLTGSCSQP
jgi:hypothetical protein